MIYAHYFQLCICEIVRQRWVSRLWCFTMLLIKMIEVCLALFTICGSDFINVFNPILKHIIIRPHLQKVPCGAIVYRLPACKGDSSQRKPHIHVSRCWRRCNDIIFTVVLVIRRRTRRGKKRRRRRRRGKRTKKRRRTRATRIPPRRRRAVTWPRCILWQIVWRNHHGHLHSITPHRAPLPHFGWSVLDRPPPIAATSGRARRDR